MDPRGVSFFPRRTNLLVDIEHRLLRDDLQYLPEGFGVSAFGHGYLVVPSDEKVNDERTLLWDAQTCLPPVGQKAWLLPVVLDEVDVIAFHFDEQSRWCVANSTISPIGCKGSITWKCSAGAWVDGQLPCDFFPIRIVCLLDHLESKAEKDIAKVWALNHNGFVALPSFRIASRPLFTD